MRNALVWEPGLLSRAQISRIRTVRVANVDSRSGTPVQNLFLNMPEIVAQMKWPMSWLALIWCCAASEQDISGVGSYGTSCTYQRSWPESCRQNATWIRDPSILFCWSIRTAATLTPALSLEKSQCELVLWWFYCSVGQMRSRKSVTYSRVPIRSPIEAAMSSLWKLGITWKSKLIIVLKAFILEGGLYSRTVGDWSHLL